MTEQRARERPVPLTQSFVTTTREQGIVEVRCRVCGTPIKKLLAAGPQKVRRVKNQTFVETQMLLCATAAYREIEFFMEDGSRHIGNVCATDAEKLRNDIALAERFCETDLAQWRTEGVTITAKMDRRPVSVGKIADHVE